MITATCTLCGAETQTIEGITNVACLQCAGRGLSDDEN